MSWISRLTQLNLVTPRAQIPRLNLPVDFCAPELHLRAVPHSVMHYHHHSEILVVSESYHPTVTNLNV